jgi:hypothetical protein
MVTVNAGTDEAKSYVETIDTTLSERSLPPYPPLPGTLDQASIDSTRRTIYVSNLDPRCTFENLHDLFCQVGEIALIRMTKSEPKSLEFENLGLRNVKWPVVVNGGHDEDQNEPDWSNESVGAYIEYAEQPSVAKALCLNGLMFANRHIRVNHATRCILASESSSQVNLDDLRRESARLRKRDHGSSSSSSRHQRSRHHRHHRSKDRHRSTRDRERDSRRTRRSSHDSDSTLVLKNYYQFFNHKKFFSFFSILVESQQYRTERLSWVPKST